MRLPWVNSRRFKLLVDTGSSYTVIRSTLLKSIGYDSQKDLSSVRITTVSGIINTPVIKVLWFSCLGQQIKEFPLVAYNLPPLTYNEAKATEYLILEQFGETAITLVTLDALQNTSERLRNAYNRLNILVFRIGEAKPLADTATLELLNRTIEQTLMSFAAIQASIQEAKGDVGL